ncbi:MAG: 5-formyltetrahydrofolate cyclo-ligase [Gammaproteobacteria bacterium]
MQEWPEIRAWRVETRQRLLDARRALSHDARRRIRDALVAGLMDALVPRIHARHVLGFYWPIRGEFDLREVVEACLARGARAALPEVVDKSGPLVFRPWVPGCAMKTGVWNIPIPDTGDVVFPDILLVPLVGFDDAGYRLGYGGGYYDRTIAAHPGRPLCVGVGMAAARLPGIHPQAHDVPMHAVLTEAGWVRPLPTQALDAATAATSACASPPCNAGDADPAYMGYLPTDELVASLNALLEAERAGAIGVKTLARADGPGPRRALLGAVADDEAYFCGMLRRHILALGGTPSERTGAFLDKLLAVTAPGPQLELLNRGQGWVVRQLDALLPRIANAELTRDLRDMRQRHVDNIARCEEKTMRT